jgi:hypothetical protein
MYQADAKHKRRIYGGASTSPSMEVIITCDIGQLGIFLRSLAVAFVEEDPL